MLINAEAARERQAQIRRDFQALNGRLQGVPGERDNLAQWFDRPRPSGDPVAAAAHFVMAILRVRRQGAR